MKGIELTPSQIKAVENGATALMFPIPFPMEYIEETNEFQAVIDNCGVFRHTFGEVTPLQKGDKFFVQEEFSVLLYDNGLISGSPFAPCLPLTRPASEMTYEQSRFKDLECVNVRVVRVQEITYPLWGNIFGRTPDFIDNEDIKFYNHQMKEQGINRTYEDNDYVFLVEFTCKEVIQYTLSGEEIARHGSGIQAAKAVNGIQSSISAVCNGKRNNHKGFIWKYS